MNLVFEKYSLTGVFSLCLLALSFALPVAAQDKPLQLKVVTSSEGSLYANFTLIMGETDLVLVDAPFTRSDAPGQADCLSARVVTCSIISLPMGPKVRR
jgi:hypothetical protein